MNGSYRSTPHATVLEKGGRICQFRIYETQPPVEFEECEALSSVDRGGFGSTGRK